MSQEIETIIGYRFSDRDLLRAALTHASSAGRERRAGRGQSKSATGNNQRLEFLGDRVLGLIIAEILLSQYPKASEGALTSRSQVLVSTVTLAEIATELNLGRWLVTDGSLTSGSAQFSHKMQADLCEALIGAIYTDGGIEAARRFILSHWEKRVAAMADPPRDPKMALQEWALERGMDLPSYTVLETQGPAHAPLFRIRVKVGSERPATAEGSSKRRAEQAAAQKLIDHLTEAANQKAKNA
ncbi:ribonuclease-3 [Arboricoccus pini]|uniref:Ribonuclease 3 n=1 Tax=Arboricoccus pini TaxID=1963835 RepID=A0A212QPV1_9PROT|nr:ribonuclease III [Arboricoccus pini]SNB61314.1 ribonuclease-3 [Arboricoccus pini]